MFKGATIDETNKVYNIGKYKWDKIFTLNIDCLLENIFEQTGVSYKESMIMEITKKIPVPTLALQGKWDSINIGVGVIAALGEGWKLLMSNVGLDCLSLMGII